MRGKRNPHHHRGQTNRGERVLVMYVALAFVRPPAVHLVHGRRRHRAGVRLQVLVRNSVLCSVPLSPFLFHA